MLHAKIVNTVLEELFYFVGAVAIIAVLGSIITVDRPVLIVQQVFIQLVHVTLDVLNVVLVIIALALRKQYVRLASILTQGLQAAQFVMQGIRIPVLQKQHVLLENILCQEVALV